MLCQPIFHSQLSPGMDSHRCHGTNQGHRADNLQRSRKLRMCPAPSLWPPRPNSSLKAFHPFSVLLWYIIHLLLSVSGICTIMKNGDSNHSTIIGQKSWFQSLTNHNFKQWLDQSPLTNQITLHNFLGSNFDYYISNKYSFSIITVVQSACQSILTYFSEKYCLQCWKDVLLRLRMVKECCTLHKVPLVEGFCQSLKLPW